MLRDIVGRAEEEIEIEAGSCLGCVFERYARQFPRLGELKSSIVLARNHQFSDRSAVIGDGDEIAFHQLVLAASMALSIGRRRSLTPVAAKMAFARAGAAETVPTSPSPPGEASLVIRCTSKGGISLIRI